MYCCPECDTVLGVESDPVIRDAGLKKVQKDFDDLKKQIDVTLRKLAAKAIQP